MLFCIYLGEWACTIWGLHSRAGPGGMGTGEPALRMWGRRVGPTHHLGSVEELAPFPPGQCGKTGSGSMDAGEPAPPFAGTVRESTVSG